MGHAACHKELRGHVGHGWFSEHSHGWILREIRDTSRFTCFAHLRHRSLIRSSMSFQMTSLSLSSHLLFQEGAYSLVAFTPRRRRPASISAASIAVPSRLDASRSNPIPGRPSVCRDSIRTPHLEKRNKTLDEMWLMIDSRDIQLWDRGASTHQIVYEQSF